MSRTWADVLEEVRAGREVLEELGVKPWYRGHRSASWTLRSSLHRHVEDLLDANSGGRIDPRLILRNEYKDLFRNFQTEAWPILDAEGRTNWGMLFAMQHHGLPTRLIDWTESFACALFFAVEDWSGDEPAAVFVLDPARLNQQTLSTPDSPPEKYYGLVALEVGFGEPVVNTSHWHPGQMPPEEDLPTIAVQPPFTNRRMVAQSAMFLFCGDGFEPLEDQYSDALRKIEIPPDLRSDARNFLDLAGRDHYGYFPDLDGLARKFKARKRRMIERLRDGGKLEEG